MIHIKIKKDPFCSIHQRYYPSGSTCRACALDVTPGKKPPKARTSKPAPKKVEPYHCGCGRWVQNAQGICPGPDC